MQILGFGGQQLSSTPQIFQALSVGGSPPTPPALPFGTPNPNVVPVQTPLSSAPVNLTLQAQPTVEAIAALSKSASISNPPVQGSPPNSTAFVNATVPNETVQQGQVTPPGGSPPQNPPGAVSFTIAAPPPDQSSTQEIAHQSVAPQPQTGPPTPPPPFTLANSSDPSQSQKATSGTASPDVAQSTAQAPAATSGASPTASLPAAANPSLVQQLVSTVQSLLIGKVYSQPVFSFFA